MMNKFEFLDRFNKPERLDVDNVGLSDLAAQLNAEIINAGNGRYLYLSTEYNLSYCHGEKSLAAILTEPRAVNAAYFDPKAPDAPIDINHVLFIDAETTGLSAASGTVAFLVGLGCLDDDVFKVHQFFLPDYPDEPAQLEAVAELAAECEYLCTFNGKCFDLPLLETRFIMQRLGSPFNELPHIDLLHSSRRFWRTRVPDTTLQTLERELLGLYRYNDTPGYLIPQLYFDFLKHGRAEPLNGVMLHNQLDIVSLMFLLVATQRYVDNAPQFDYYSPEEALIFSRFHLRRRELERSCLAAGAQFDRNAGD
jgi:hypothetical protein